MLNEYKRKRDFKKTPEPEGEPAQPSGQTSEPSAQTRSGSRRQTKSGSNDSLKFVIQKHDARKLHYDFRLEIDGVLVSWAVPKGPALDPREKRFAVQTEDHPMDYGGFEGSIPAGEYGAGEVIVWDHGTYTPDEDGQLSWHDREEAQRRMQESLKSGKISVFLQGEKLKGSWTLVKLKNKDKDNKEWLLIKHHDPFAQLNSDPTEQDQSVITGRTLHDIKEGKVAGSRKRKKVELGKASPFPKLIPPMLASLADTPFSRNGWVFEPQVDGIRAVAYIRNGGVVLRSRRGVDLTGQFPILAKRLAQYKTDMVLDGAIIALNEKGRPSFQQLQLRLGLTRGADIDIAECKTPIFYYVFDIMYGDGRDLQNLPAWQRREILQDLVVPRQEIRLIEQFKTDGKSAFQACLENDLEGVVAKRVDGLYESGLRSEAWLKVKATMRAEFLICGFTQGTDPGAQSSPLLQSFGPLILGENNEDGELTYVGAVGTGFDDNELSHLMKVMKPLIKKQCPFKKRPAGNLEATWVIPELVAEIKFAGRTADNMLRAPVFLHLRDDIEAKDVKPTPIVETEDLRPVTVEDKAKSKYAEVDDVLSQLDNDKEKLELEVEGNKIAFSNLDKVFWPATSSQPAVTKREYVRYLARVSPYLLPHLRDRLITFVRFPNGITQGRFYQKHWEHKLPPFVSSFTYFTEHINHDQEFLHCNNLSTLLWLGQIADLELHTSHSRNNPEPDAHHLSMDYTGSVEQVESSMMNYPDYIVLDLDPYMYSGKEKKGAEPELHKDGFKQACDVAFWIKELLDSLKIESFLKTSGRTGLHIYIPIIRRIDYDTVRALSEVILRQILKDHPEDATMDWAVVKRKGKTFLDHNMNARGKSLSSIYSPRVAPEASVSTPLRWEELRSIYPTQFTIWTVPERLAQVGDLWSDILDHKNDVEKLLIKNEGVAESLTEKMQSKQKKKRGPRQWK